MPSGVPPAPLPRSAPVFCCPFCQTEALPTERSKVSQAGWITLVVLLFTIPCVFWIGLLMKEHYKVCGSCGITLG